MMATYTLQACVTASASYEQMFRGRTGLHVLCKLCLLISTI
jgi:hypothetical protein